MEHRCYCGRRAVTDGVVPTVRHAKDDAGQTLITVHRRRKRLAERGMLRMTVGRDEHQMTPAGWAVLRREVAYYDRVFLSRLGRTPAEAQIVDTALRTLKEHGLVSRHSTYDAAAFERHRAEIKATFTGTWTSLTPTMERLIYMLTSVKRPRHLLELGSFWGYTLAWFAGPCIGTNRAYEAERIIGIDVDGDMTDRASANFARLANGDGVQLIAGDARLALADIPGPFDFCTWRPRTTTPPNRRVCI